MPILYALNLLRRQLFLLRRAYLGLATARNSRCSRGLTPQAAHPVIQGKPFPIRNRKIEEKSMKHLGIAALGIVGALAFAATNASAAIVCNDNGDCWHVKENIEEP